MEKGLREQHSHTIYNEHTKSRLLEGDGHSQISPFLNEPRPSGSPVMKLNDEWKRNKNHTENFINLC